VVVIVVVVDVVPVEVVPVDVAPLGAVAEPFEIFARHAAWSVNRLAALAAASSALEVALLPEVDVADVVAVEGVAVLPDAGVAAAVDPVGDVVPVLAARSASPLAKEALAAALNSGTEPFVALAVVSPASFAAPSLLMLTLVEASGAAVVVVPALAVFSAAPLAKDAFADELKSGT